MYTSFIGGESARTVAPSLADAGIRFLPDFAEFRRVLGEMEMARGG